MRSYFTGTKKNPSYRNISNMLCKMQDAFTLKIKELNESLSTTIDLSLKFIVHYGKFSQYTIGRFKKLYGKTIVEAHQLLKNEFAEQPSYVLFSHSFLDNSRNYENECTADTRSIPEVGVIHYFEKTEQHI